MYAVSNYPELKRALSSTHENRQYYGLADVHLRAATAILKARMADGGLDASVYRLADAIHCIGRTLIPYASSQLRWQAYIEGVRYETEAAVNERWQTINDKALASGKVDWRYSIQLTISLADTIEAQLSA